MITDWPKVLKYAKRYLKIGISKHDYIELIENYSDLKAKYLREGGLREMKKRRTEKKKTIEPTGTITPLKDYFKPVKNIGVFPKPKIERGQK